MNGNLVTVKNAFGNNDGLWHYGKRLIERTTEPAIVICPFYSASSVKAINQWLDALGYPFHMTRRNGKFRLEDTSVSVGKGWHVEETADGFKIKAFN